MKFLSFKDLLNSSIYFTPNFPLLQTKRYRFGFFKVFGIFLAYSLFVLLISLTLILFTPLRNFVIKLERSELKQQMDRVERLENQVVFLTKELEALSSINKKLKYALILGSGQVKDTSSATYDSLKKELKKPLRNKSSVVDSFVEFFKNIFPSDSGNMLYFYPPVQGFIINKFDLKRLHPGVDYASKINSPVVASAGGLIIFADFTVKDGYTIIIQHDNGYLTFYKHLAIILKKEREYVTSGETIALVGNTGFDTTGPHLHFEIWKENKPIDPLDLLINK